MTAPRDLAAALRSEPAEVSAMARMNIAAMDDEALSGLERFFRNVAEHGTEGGRERAPAYLAAITAERESRGAGAGQEL